MKMTNPNESPPFPAATIGRRTTILTSDLGIDRVESPPRAPASPTLVYGVAAAGAGLVSYPSSGEHFREPAWMYAAQHPGPVELRWQHKDRIGHVRALRRDNDALYVLAESELEPDELAILTRSHGPLRFSTGTTSRPGDLLRIIEVSLTDSPASVGLPEVRWAVEGNATLPRWVGKALEATEHRTRYGTLQVIEDTPKPEATDNYETYYEEMAALVGAAGGLEGRWQHPISGTEFEVSYHPGRILSVR